MLEILKKLFGITETSIVEDPEEELAVEETEEWKKVKVYDRSNSETKQVYYEKSYLCSCSSEEIPILKPFIVMLIHDGTSLEEVKEEIKSFKKSVFENGNLFILHGG